MKKKYYAYSLAGLLCVFSGYQAFTFSSGAPAGNSGSPLSGGSCSRSGCHNGPAPSDQSTSISSNIPSTGFLENSTYSITIDANAGSVGSSRIGFMASVEDPAGHVGSIRVSDASRTQKVGSYITHRFAGSSATNNQNSWSFDWDSEQAPDQSTVYVAVNYTNGNGNTSGDILQTQTLVLSKERGIGLAEPELSRFELYPNPAVDDLLIRGNRELTWPLQAIDAQGKVLAEWAEADSPSPGHWQISVALLPAGTYLLRDAQANTMILQKQ